MRLALKLENFNDEYLCSTRHLESQGYSRAVDLVKQNESQILYSMLQQKTRSYLGIVYEPICRLIDLQGDTLIIAPIYVCQSSRTSEEYILLSEAGACVCKLSRTFTDFYGALHNEYATLKSYDLKDCEPSPSIYDMYLSMFGDKALSKSEFDKSSSISSKTNRWIVQDMNTLEPICAVALRRYFIVDFISVNGTVVNCKFDSYNKLIVADNSGATIEHVNVPVKFHDSGV